MKTPASALAVMCALSLLFQPASGQTTITTAIVSAEFAVGKSIVNHSDTSTTTINIGSPGSTSWDFTGLLSHTTTTLSSVTVGSTPLAGNFPGATHAVSAPVTIFGISTTGYQYLTIGANVLNLGSGAPILAPPIINSGSAVITNSPVEVLYALPSTFGSTWTSAFTATTNVVINGFPQTPSSVSHNYFYKVDAYGPMTMPGGKVTQGLRIKRVDSVATKSVAYLFISDEGALVQITAADTLQPNSGVISVVRKTVSWTAADPALPIQLASFSASVVENGGGIQLTWTTLSEQENYGFTVQRRAGTSGDFVSIPGSFVPGHGTTVEPQTYGYLDVSVPSGVVQYRLAQADRDGSVHYTDPITVNSVTGIQAGGAPAVYSLSQNFPNPFNPTTTISYTIGGVVAPSGAFSSGVEGPASQNVKLAIYDLLGREVARLVDGVKQPGRYDVKFDAAGLSSGVYLYRLQAGTFVETKKMTLAR